MPASWVQDTRLREYVQHHESDPVASDPQNTIFCEDNLKGEVCDETIVLASTKSGQKISIPMGLLPDLIEFLQSVFETGRRRAFRVPVRNEELDVTITRNGIELVVEPLDISTIGIGVRLLSNSEDISVDDSVEVSLCHTAQLMTLSGIVRNCSDGFLGISFPSCLTYGEPTPPEELRQIVQQLQLSYIRRKRSE